MNLCYSSLEVSDFIMYVYLFKKLKCDDYDLSRVMIIEHSDQTCELNECKERRTKTDKCLH